MAATVVVVVPVQAVLLVAPVLVFSALSLFKTLTVWLVAAVAVVAERLALHNFQINPVRQPVEAEAGEALLTVQAVQEALEAGHHPVPPVKPHR
jgi:hypothetical protein